MLRNLEELYNSPFSIPTYFGFLNVHIEENYKRKPSLRITSAPIDFETW
jgi:hypothetical protein